MGGQKGTGDECVCVSVCADEGGGGGGEYSQGDVEKQEFSED